MAHRTHPEGTVRKLADRLLRHDHEPCLRCWAGDVFWRVAPLRHRHRRRRLLLQLVLGRSV